MYNFRFGVTGYDVRYYVIRFTFHQLLIIDNPFTFNLLPVTDYRLPITLPVFG